MHWFKLFTGIISIPSINNPSKKLSYGKNNLFILHSLAPIIIGSIPLTFWSFPSKESSPINILSFKYPSSFLINSLKIPIDIAKSRKDPSFFISAGDKFTTILELGNLYPLFIIADFTRSLDSFISVLAKPTILNEGIPLVISISIFIR